MPRRPSFKLLLALVLTAMIGAALLFSAAAPARAADAAAFEAAVAALDQKSFGDKAEAVDAL
ncbi:MAG: urea ABC transporter permease subunit UrtB, partial [Caenispirillum bisanense]|nr:urea ABC transporter permease subunit UrtB [Caenispirillum bisanense]